MLELFIVRHGESTRNYACLLAHKGDPTELERQLQEEPDEAPWPLTSLGHEQAKAAGGWLRSVAGKMDAGYCSPYVRTMQTAQDLGLGIDFVTDIRLRERDWGQYPNGAYKTDEYLQDLAECGKFEWKSRFPSSESLRDLVPESQQFLEDVCKSYPSGKVVAVSHGGRMGAFEYVLHGYIPTRRFANCCILQVRLDTSVSGHPDGETRVLYPAQPELSPTDWVPMSLPVPV